MNDDDFEKPCRINPNTIDWDDFAERYNSRSVSQKDFETKKVKFIVRFWDFFPLNNILPTKLMESLGNMYASGTSKENIITGNRRYR